MDVRTEFADHDDWLAYMYETGSFVVMTDDSGETFTIMDPVACEKYDPIYYAAATEAIAEQMLVAYSRGEIEVEYDPVIVGDKVELNPKFIVPDDYQFKKE